MFRGFEDKNIMTLCSQFPSKNYKFEDGGEQDFVKAMISVMMPLKLQCSYSYSFMKLKDVTLSSRRFTA